MPQDQIFETNFLSVAFEIILCVMSTVQGLGSVLSLRIIWISIQTH